MALLAMVWVLGQASPAAAQGSDSSVQSLSAVYFGPFITDGSNNIAGAAAEWQVTGIVSQAVYGPVTLSVYGPPGTQFPSDLSDYQLTGTESAVSSATLVPTAVYVGAPANSVAINFAPSPAASSLPDFTNQLLLTMDNVVNPPPGTYNAQDFTLSLNNGPPVATSPSNLTETFANPLLGTPAVTPSVQQGGASSTWAVTFAVYSNPTYTGGKFAEAGDQIVLTGPAGTVFSTDPQDYTITAANQPIGVATTFSTTGSPSTVALTLQSSIPANTTVTVTAAGVTNPPAGTYPGTDFAVGWSGSATSSAGSATSYGAQALTFGSLQWTPDTSLVAGANATWTATVLAPAAAQQWTFTAPWTFPSDSTAYAVSVDNGSPSTPTAVYVSGGLVTLNLPQPVSAGDSVAVTVHDATNPASETQPGSAWTVSEGSATLMATQGYTWVGAEPPPTVQVTTFQAGAPGVTWTLSFPAEVAPNGGDGLTLYVEGAGLPGDPAEYLLSVGNETPQHPATVQLLTSGPGGCTSNCGAQLTWPAMLTAVPGATVQVQIEGVTNPSTPQVQVAVALSGVPAGPLTAWPPAGAGAFTASGTTSGAPGPGTVDFSQVDPLPAKPLQDGTGTTLSVAMQPLGTTTCNDLFQKDLSNGANFEGYTCANVLWNPTNPPGSGGPPQAVYYPNGPGSPGVFVAQSPTVEIQVANASGCLYQGPQAPPANAPSSSCSLSVYAAQVVNGSTPQWAKLPSTFQFTPPPSSQGSQTGVNYDTLSFTLPNVGTQVTIVEQVTYNTPPPGCGSSCPTVFYAFAAPIEVVQVPSEVEQLTVLPFKILYQPPGSGSTAQYSMLQGQSTETDYSFTQATQNSTTSEQDVSLGFDAAAYVFGLGAELTYSHGWDEKATNTQLNSSTTSQGVIYQVSEKQTWQTAKGSGQATAVPWQGDQFVLLVHPQFAVWDEAVCSGGAVPVQSGQGPTQCPSGSEASTAGNSPLTYAMIGADSTLLEISAGTLAQCAEGVPQQIGGYNPAVELTPRDCQNLLALDPFAAAANQAVSPNDVLGGLQAQPVGTVITAQGSGGTYTVDLSQSTVSTQGLTSTTNYSATVDTVSVDQLGAQVGLNGNYLDSEVQLKAEATFGYTSVSGQSATQEIAIQTSSTENQQWQKDVQGHPGQLGQPDGGAGLAGSPVGYPDVPGAATAADPGEPIVRKRRAAGDVGWQGFCRRTDGGIVLPRQRRSLRSRGNAVPRARQYGYRDASRGALHPVSGYVHGSGRILGHLRRAVLQYDGGGLRTAHLHGASAKRQ